MFNNIKSTGASNNKNENVLNSKTNSVDVKVERESGDEVQQSEIYLYNYTYNVIKEEMAVGHEVLEHAVYSSNCPEVTATHPASHANTSEPSQNNSNDRNGSIIKLETEAMSAVREEPTEELYADHEIKDEMVIGPVVLQAVTYVMEENETHPASRAKTSEPSQNNNSNDRNGSIMKLEAEAMSAVREDPTEELYADHVIKDEMVIGPVVLQAVTYMMEENGESLPKKLRLDTQANNTVPDNTAKQTRTEMNTEEIILKYCNGNTEPSDTKPMENVKNTIPTMISKHRNNTQKNIRNDKNNKTTKNIFQCNVCAKQYDKKPDLAQHIESHDKTKRDIYFKCKECTYQSVTQCSLERHLRLHDKSRRFVCDVCGYRYPDNTRLQRHLRCVHSDEKIHECGNCDYKTNIILNLNTHLRIHSGEKPYSCSQYEFKCSHKSSLEKHSRIHTGEKPYSCSQYEFKRSDKTSLKTHSRIHTDEKPYSCTLCEYKFRQKSHLKTHSLIHTGEKPYSCSLCDYTCNRKSNLKIHSLIHSGEKPYSCSLCNYKCNHKSHLKRHSLNHTREKPYSCSLCNYKCNRSSRLKKHMNSRACK